ncbi:hypothetical protein B0919_02510 [Hymenobacter sp. CRA2]|nr:hypothetical protein B0919_02510 [Hymenobacter sp. CRA2]
MLAALLAATGCRPDSPTTDTPAAAHTPTPAASATENQPAAAATDTFQLPDGQVIALRPSSAAVFERLAAAETLPPDLDAESRDQNLTATQGRVRRDGLDLLLQPAQGPVVRLHSTPPAEFTLENGDAVRYVYWGSLPQAHQWVVQAWFWESSAVMLVDQRTGRQLEVAGRPAASPDGRYVLSTSPGLGGGDQVNSLSLVQIEAAGPRLLWQREPEAWAPERARWAGSGRALLRISRVDSAGQLPEPPAPAYVELALPAAP